MSAIDYQTILKHLSMPHILQKSEFQRRLVAQKKSHCPESIEVMLLRSKENTKEITEIDSLITPDFFVLEERVPIHFAK